MLIFFAVTAARGENLKFVWEYEPDVTIDGFKLYDQNGVVMEIPADRREITIDIPGVPDAATDYIFIMRAYRDDKESGDSNTAGYTVVNIIPPTPIGLTGEYADDTVTLHWDQPGDDWPIASWAVYYRLPGGEFIRLDTVQQGTLTAPIPDVPTGELTRIDFVVVAYRSSGAASVDSNVFSVDVDRREVPPVQNLTIKIPML